MVGFIDFKKRDSRIGQNSFRSITRVKRIYWIFFYRMCSINLLNCTINSRLIRKYKLVELNRIFVVDLIILIFFVIIRISMIELFDMILSKFDSQCLVDLNFECFTRVLFLTSKSLEMIKILSCIAVELVYVCFIFKAWRIVVIAIFALENFLIWKITVIVIFASNIIFFDF